METKDEREVKAKELLALGLGEKKVRRETGLHWSTVSKLKRELGEKAATKTIGGTPAEREAARGRKKSTALVITGAAHLGPRTIHPGEFGKVDVDRGYYQRQLQPALINELIHVLESGGIIPDRITVAVRTYDKSGKYWIVDGQQRFMAYMEANKPLEADLFSVESLEAERMLFIALNRHIRVNADATVHAHHGPTADLIRRCAGDENHPLYDRISFGQRRTSTPYSAAMLARACATAMTGRVIQGAADRTLDRGDHEMLKGEIGIKHKALYILRLIPLVWPGPDAPRSMLACALAKVASERWDKKLEMPDHKIVARIRRINWEKHMPTYAGKFSPIAEKLIRDKWPSRS